MTYGQQRTAMIVVVAILSCLAALVPLNAYAAPRSATSTMPPLVRRAIQVQDHALSFRTDTDQSVTDPNLAPGDQAYIYVRRGARWESYQHATDENGQSIGPDRVATATQTCTRDTGDTTWSCTAEQNTTDVNFQKARWAALGKRHIGGAQCQGFRTTVYSPDVNTRQTITFWIDPRTGYPVRQDTIIHITLDNVSGPDTANYDLFSHWNDPHLIALVPRIPALTSGVR